MEPLNVVLLQGDSRIAQSLVSALSQSFRAVDQVHSLGELRTRIAKDRSRIVIVDTEAIPLAEVERLSREFPGSSIVCTHRLPDEELWTAALSAGASDMCSASDTGGIVRSALQSIVFMQSAAA
jgi:hypothetical protein